MAIGQVTVPWLPGYAFGVGADLATGSPMGKVVGGPEKSVQRAAGATITFDVQRIQSTEELERASGSMPRQATGPAPSAQRLCRSHATICCVCTAGSMAR
jgi:hypothetical protein